MAASLGQTQPELRILDDQQGIPGLHRPVLLEVYLPDKTLHPRIDRGNVPPHLGIVGKLHADMDKTAQDVCKACQQKADYDYIVDQFLKFP